jgi:ubiquinone/menaquinone biosynthesis C-methylase UbiE
LYNGRRIFASQEADSKNLFMLNAEGPSFVDPEKIISQIDVASGATVADFGCGSGYFSFEFSRVVGAEGKVYALDILPQALEAVASHAKLMGMHNIVTKRANLEREGGSTLGLASVDWAILKDMLFQNEHKSIIITEMTRVLKPGGHALVMEWNPKASALGPDKNLRIDPEELKTLLSAAGLSLEKSFPAGGYHYAFLVKKM